MWISDDRSTISGGGQHALKTSEADYKSKKLALIAKLAQCRAGPYKVPGIILWDQEQKVLG